MKFVCLLSIWAVILRLSESYSFENEPNASQNIRATRVEFNDSARARRVQPSLMGIPTGSTIFAPGYAAGYMYWLNNPRFASGNTV